MKLTISLIQMDCKEGEPEANFAHAEAGIREAAGRASDLVLLPELWASGYDLAHAARYASRLEEGAFARTAAMARRYCVWVTGSLLELGEDGAYYNTACLWDPTGKLRGVYRKTHLFRLMQEDRYLSPGQDMDVFDLPWGRVALAICYDLRFPELFRRYALAGAVLTLIPSEWPHPRMAHWQTLLRARAIENQMFIAGCNRAGVQGDTVFGGRSAIIDPWGTALVEGAEEAAVLTAELDLARVDQVRQEVPVWRDRRSDLYGD